MLKTVRMDTKGNNKQLNEILLAIILISTFASLLCLVYLLSRPKKNLCNRGKRTVICLCLSDFLASLFWALNNLFQFGCPYVGALNLFGYNASAMWTSAIGLFLYLKIKGCPMPPDKYFHIVCWGAALASVLGASLSDKILVIPRNGCWLVDKDSQLFFSSLPQYISFAWNTIFLSLNVRELQRLKATSHSLTPRLSNHHTPASISAATNGQRGMLFMHACYVLYTIGPVLQAVTQDHSPVLSYLAMILAASKGLLNVVAVHEGRMRRIVNKLYNKTPRFCISNCSKHQGDQPTTPIFRCRTSSPIPLEGIAIS